MFLLLFPLLSPAQDLPEVDDEAAIEEYSDEMSFLAAHPVNLNHAGLDELHLLPGLSPYQVLRLFQYLKNNPDISDPFVLAADSVLDRTAIEAILPYICFDQQAENRRSSSGSVSLRVKRSLPLPHESWKWYDSPWDTRGKMSYNRGDWELFAQAQKDAGESSYYDFYSACIKYAPLEKWLKVLAGDYSVSIGRGLILGGTSRTIVSAGWAKTFATGSNCLKPYHSSDEDRALRGIAVKCNLPWDSDLTGFFSYRKIDASLDSFGLISRITTGGYHRDTSLSAQSGWDNASELLAGARLGHTLRNGLDLGFSACRVSYTPRLSDSTSYSGSAGADLRFVLAEIIAFGEFAANMGKKKAGIFGIAYKAGSSESHFQFYSYQQGYRSPGFNALENFGGQDEQGAVLGNGLKLPYKTKVDGLYWLFHSGSTGELLKGQGGYQLEFAAVNGIINNLEFSWRWRQKVKEELIDVSEADLAADCRKTSYRLSLTWQLGKNAAFYTQYQAGRYRMPLIFQNDFGEVFSLGLRMRNLYGMDLSGQSAFFDCSSYDARLYLSEPEITGSGSFHGYWGRGRRDAMVIGYKFRRSVSCEAKAAREVRDYRGETVKKTEIGFQAGYSW